MTETIPRRPILSLKKANAPPAPPPAAAKPPPAFKPREIIERLAAAHPATFSMTKPKPLAIGIAELLMAAHPEMSKNSIRRALSYYTGLIAYLKAHQEGDRIGLDSKPTGKVTKDQATGASERLAKIKPKGTRLPMAPELSSR
jgi:sRNA-binding protein